MTTLLLSLSLLGLQDKKPELPPVQMGKAQLCFLVESEKVQKGGMTEIRADQKAHLEFLEGLWKEKKALMVGPLEGAGKRAGLIVLDVETSEAAKAVLAKDPFVKAGTLEVETFTWFFAKNYVTNGPKFMDLQPVWFGMLERQPNLPTLTKEEGEKLQEGHMANITKMAEGGSLMLAGPMVENTPFRGIFVFRDMTKDKIAELTAPDPLIKAGRLKLSVYRWRVPKGTFLLEH